MKRWRWIGGAVALVLLVLAGVLGAMVWPRESQGRERAQAPRVYGCAGLFVDHEGRGRCVARKARALTLGVELQSEAEGEVEVEVHQRLGPLRWPLPLSRRSSSVGELLRVEPGVHAGVLELRVMGARERRFELELVPASVEARALRRAVLDRGRGGRWAEAEAIAALGAARFGHGSEVALELRCLLAQLAFETGRTAEVGARADALAAELDGHRRLRTASCVALAQVQAAYFELYLEPDFNAAQARLAALEAQTRGAQADLQIRVGADYLRGILEHRLGNIDESLRAFAAAARLAGELGDARQYASARVMEAVALARLGRFEEAQELAGSVEAELEALDPGGAGRDLVLDIRLNVGWIALLRRDDDLRAPDPRPQLRELVARLAEDADDPRTARARLNLALAELQHGDLDATRAELEALAGAALDAHNLVWRELIAGRAALRAGELDEAEDRFDRAALYVELSRDPEYAWRVATWQGELALARGQPELALEAFTRATKIADELALAVPVSEGRSTFVTGLSRAAIGQAETALALGRSQQGFCAIVGARARHLRAMWSRMRPELDAAEAREYRRLLAAHERARKAVDAELDEAWALSAEELAQLRDALAEQNAAADVLLEQATAILERAAPKWSCDRVRPREAGEAALTMIAEGEGPRWFVLARAEGVEHVRVDAGLEPEAAARVALEALRDAGALAGVEHLRVIPTRRYLAVDFAGALTELGERPQLSYSLGLGRGSEATDTPAPDDEAPRASVVADAQTLVGAEAEAEAVAARLRELGWVVEDRWSPQRESQPRLLHFSGHGHRAGLDGWDSYLELPDTGRLRAAEIVAAQRAPELVVLSACSAAAPDPEAIDGGMNLAAAFLLAGSRLVVAPTVAVDDARAEELGRSLYAKLERPSVASIRATLGELQRAELDAEAEPLPPSHSFTSWRAWEP